MVESTKYELGLKNFSVSISHPRGYIVPENY